MDDASLRDRATAAEPVVSALRDGIPSAMWAEDDGGVIGFMDTVDFECELGAASGGNRIHPSPEDLLRRSPCAAKCGVVEVRVYAVREVVPQNLWDDDEDEEAQGTLKRKGLSSGHLGTGKWMAIVETDLGVEVRAKLERPA